MANDLYQTQATSQARRLMQASVMPQDELFTEIDVKAPLPHVSGGDEGYDRGSYLTHLSEKYGIMPDRPHMIFRTRPFIRPFKQENLHPSVTYDMKVPLMKGTLPVPGNATDDRLRETMRRTFPVIRDGRVNSSGQQVASFATGQIAVPRQTKYEVARAPRSLRNEIEAGFRVRRNQPIKGRTVVQYQLPTMNRKLNTKDDELPEDTSVWKRRFATRHFNTQVTNMNSRQLEPRLEAVQKPFIDRTLSGRMPVVSSVNGIKDNNPQIQRLIPFRKRKGLYEYENRRGNPDNGQYTGASYYFTRKETLYDTQTRDTLSTAAYTPSWATPNGPPLASFQMSSLADHDRTLQYGREEHSAKYQYPDMYQHKQDSGLPIIEKTTPISTTLAPQKLWIPRRNVVLQPGHPNVSAAQALEPPLP
jgi:hypothetical protein